MDNRGVLVRDLAMLTVWAAGIFLVSAIPRLSTGLEQDYAIRKVAHVLEFGILTILIIRVFRHCSSHHPDVSGGSGVLAFVYALSDEVHQLGVPGRDGSLRDAGIDGLGILLVLFIMTLPRIRASVVKRKIPGHARNLSKTG